MVRLVPASFCGLFAGLSPCRRLRNTFVVDRLRGARNLNLTVQTKCVSRVAAAPAVAAVLLLALASACGDETRRITPAAARQPCSRARRSPGGFNGQLCPRGWSAGRRHGPDERKDASPSSPGLRLPARHLHHGCQRRQRHADRHA
jgi:hypothetical protein